MGPKAQLNISDFAMPEEEEGLLKQLLQTCQPGLIAEFGSGGSTRILASCSDAKVVTWDNMPEWVATVREAFKDEPWAGRVDWRQYDVKPEGPRDVEKAPPSWDGPQFDLAFVDGPRSAHATSFGRSGSFRFAQEHVRDGGIIIWHDHDREHEQEMARAHFGRYWFHRQARIGWCVKRPVPRAVKWFNRGPLAR